MAGMQEGGDESIQAAPVVLSFASSFAPGNTNNLSLIQFPDELYQKINADPTFTMKFKGREGDEAVLVTEDRTYLVRKGETSNSQLLFDIPTDKLLSPNDENMDSNTDRIGEEAFSSAIANILDHYELQPAAPRLRGLRSLLARRPYAGPDMDEEDDMSSSSPQRLSRSEIERRLQASAKEVRDAMDLLGALEVDGKMCVMDARYESNLMTKVLAAAVLLDIDLQRCTLAQFKADKDVSAYPTFVLENFLGKYSSAAPAPASPDHPAPMDLDHPSSPRPTYPRPSRPRHARCAVCGSDGAGGGRSGDGWEGWRAVEMERLAVFRAEELLAALPPNTALPLPEFLSAWQTMLPAQARVDGKLLKGRALLENKRNQVTVRALSAEHLSPEPKLRFKQLFTQAPAWTKEDLLPFLEDIVGPGLSADQLLLKHTRLTRSKAEDGSELKLYTTR